MKSRNRKYFVITLSLLVTLYFFAVHTIELIGMIRDPLTFNFRPMIWCVVLIVVMFLHGGAYVMFLDQKDKVRAVDDDEEWWKKWDRV